MQNKQPLLPLIIIFYILVITPVVGKATPLPETVSISSQLQDSLNYLIAYAGQNQRPSDQLDTGRIEDVLDFVLSSKDDTVRYQPQQVQGAPAAYAEVTFNVSLEQIISLAYNPDIPGVLTSPTSIRMSQWRIVNGRKQPLPDLRPMLDGLRAPVILTGIEYIENTPDTTSGAYYDYDLYRALILLRHRDRNILISTSAQKGISGVGKKGIILGADQNWDYLYTGQPGNNMTGVSWAKTYMYDSYAVSVYCETDADKPTVKAGFFKWVRAGWANFNLVRTEHIYSGLMRFIPAYKQILESPNLMDVNSVERTCEKIRQLSTDRLRQLTQDHFKKLATHYARTPGVSSQQINSVLKSPEYIAKLNRLEMESLLIIDYIKKLLGKDNHTESN